MLLVAPRPPKAAPVTRGGQDLVPGVVLAAVAVAAAMALAAPLDVLSPLVLAVVIGVIAANSGRLPAATAPGLAFCSRTLLRLGVALLGFQLSLVDILSLGVAELLLVVGTVVATFTATRWLARRLGLGEDLGLLVATGYSICGASAIAAMDDVTHADEEDVAVSVALVALCGTLAIAVLPLLRFPLGLDEASRFGWWVGASVHDVGQVVATAAGGGDDSVHAAVLVKLTRVLMLAPLVMIVARLRARTSLPATTPGDHPRPRLVPMFLVGFLAAAVVRSTEWVPTGALEGIGHVKDVLLAAGLFALGTGVHAARLVRVGPRPFLLGLGSWAVIAAVSYAGVLLVGA